MKRFPHLHAVALASVIVTPLWAQTHKTTAAPTDTQIEAQVQKAIDNDHAFSGSSILSSVNKGVVKLTGNVRSETEKELVSNDLANITGVKSVLNNLNIVDNTFHAPPPPPAPAGPTGPKVITLAAGTVIPVRLTNEIDTKTAKPNDTFHTTTASSINLAGFTPFQPAHPLSAGSWTRRELVTSAGQPSSPLSWAVFVCPARAHRRTFPL